MATRLFRNARLVTMADPACIVPVERAAILSVDGRIAYAGPEADMPADMAPATAETTDLAGRLVTPGLIDCHTHLVHGGDRAREFEMRLSGASYEEIARAGGGIVSTVAATRTAGVEGLVGTALPRLDHLIAEGVTTVEVKSGYGLSPESEIAQLRAAHRLASERKITVSTSFLGAHALPPEFKGDRAGYLALVRNEMLPAVAAGGLADCVDAFCESIAFSPDEVDALFSAARSLGLKVRLHADQLSNLGGAALAARHGALSADHLEHTDEAGAAAMAAAGTVAVLLPGAFYFIRERQLPPVDLFRKHGTRIAIATDCNPGTSPLTSPLLVMNMAATLFRLTVAECLAGMTIHAATALGLEKDTGTIVAGKWCDLAVWDAERPAELVYRMGFNPLAARYWRGE